MGSVDFLVSLCSPLFIQVHDRFEVDHSMFQMLHQWVVCTILTTHVCQIQRLAWPQSPRWGTWRRCRCLQNWWSNLLVSFYPTGILDCATKSWGVQNFSADPKFLHSGVGRNLRLAQILYPLWMLSAMISNVAEPHLRDLLYSVSRLKSDHCHPLSPVINMVKEGTKVSTGCEEIGSRTSGAC